MSNVEYPNRSLRKSQLAGFTVALVFSLQGKRVNGSVDWRDLLHVDSREVASGSTLAMIHAVMGWPCAEITRKSARSCGVILTPLGITWGFCFNQKERFHAGRP